MLQLSSEFQNKMVFWIHLHDYTGVNATLHVNAF